MAITPTIYGLFLESLIEGRVDVTADELWCMIVTSTYVFNQNSHKFKSIVTGELEGSGYSTGGQLVTTSAAIYTSSDKTLNLPAGNLVWPSVIWTGAVGAVLYMNPSGFPDDAKPLVAYIDFGGPQNRSDQAFYLNWAATGVLKLAVP
jgi:hypothetical protein